MKVNLTYFKSSGKYYSEGSYEADHLPGTILQTFWEEVARMNREGRLPDLFQGHSPYFVLISIPEHPNNHPHLVVPQLFRTL
jgi:hypothetical protein